MTHPLFVPFTIKTITRNTTKKEPFDFCNSLKKLCTLRSVENLLYFLNHVNFDHIEGITDISIFKEGIEPLWEDKSNISGGKWIIKLRREVSTRLFQKLLIRMVRQPFDKIDVNGIVISFRMKNVILAVWTKDSTGKDRFKDVLMEIKKVLDIKFFLSVEYKDNDESLKDNSSFRNTKNLYVQ
ncbi:putative mRNA cap-binding protein [Trachipleistophora hominis]|uniref:Putative mRNA cap-binding protein n=1 Tax=Trachipleistophora hominis TaxID=72359 RepID=L7JXF7_TRAHO|nr:putative mRNA cap-binding protein [Trachipleistophora hominis]